MQDVMSRHGDYIAAQLYELSRRLEERQPETQARGLLGGTYGYGQEFENETFSMFPYTDADCDCGFDAMEEAWERQHMHLTPEESTAIYNQWRDTHDHTDTCILTRPNFRCGDIEVTWYKYIGRGMTINREATREELDEAFRQCFASLSS